MKRRATVLVVLAPLALLACRDILRIAGDTTIADGSVPSDGSADAVPLDGPITTACGQISLVTSIGEPMALTADANGVFWAELRDAESGAIYGWVNGALVEIASSTPTPIDVRVDDNYVYWNAWNQFPAPTSPPTLNAWPRNTTTPQTTTVPLNVTAGHISSDGTKLYFGTWQTQDGGIYAMPLPLANNAPQKVVGGLDSPYHVLVEANRIYYDEGADKNGVGTKLSVLDLGDGGVTVIHDAPTEVDDITAINDVGFWAQSGANQVERSDHTLYSPIPNPTAISIDPGGSTFLFVASNGNLLRVNADDRTMTTCFTADEIGQLASTDGRTYFTARFSQAWSILGLDLPP